MIIRPDFARLIREIGVVKFGSFRLVTHELDPSAPIAPIFFDFGKQPNGPVSESLLVELVNSVLSCIIRRENVQFTSVAGVPEGMNPYAAVLARLYGVPPILLAKERKGVVRVPEGTVIPAGPVLVVEDVVTRAISSLSAVMALRGAGATVHHVVAIVDREEGGVPALKDADVVVHVGWKLRSYLLRFWLDNGLITPVQYHDTMIYLDTTRRRDT